MTFIEVVYGNFYMVVISSDSYFCFVEDSQNMSWAIIYKCLYQAISSVHVDN